MSRVHNALDRATDLIRGFRRSIGMLGPDGGLERFGETLTPSINIWQQPEWSVLRGELLQWCNATLAAGGAGFRSQLMIRPVATQRMIVVVESIECDGNFNIRTGNLANLGTAQSTHQRDTRNPTDARAVVTSSIGAAAVGTVRYQVFGPPYRYEKPIVIHSDGDGTNAGAIVVDPRADNTAINVSITFRTRNLFSGENPYA